MINPDTLLNLATILISPYVNWHVKFVQIMFQEPSISQTLPGIATAYGFDGRVRLLARARYLSLHHNVQFPVLAVWFMIFSCLASDTEDGNEMFLRNIGYAALYTITTTARTRNRGLYLNWLFNDTISVVGWLVNDEFEFTWTLLPRPVSMLISEGTRM
jgi:hypothetical protein